MTKINKNYTESLIRKFIYCNSKTIILMFYILVLATCLRYRVII